ncbi:CoA transferase [Paenarthrobacter sp. NPDC056912]|uniref:CoA transferase n=1 Tax=Paenarthrobacter sp. NPDC056912 TaxID=3345965 RepID=UPI00366B7AB5
MDSVPDLSRSLRGIAALSRQPVAPVSGPRRWWGGALDVEGLALGSVQAAATALNALTGSAGMYSVASGPTGASFDSLSYLRIDGRKPVGFAPLSGFRRTKNGWIRLHANYPHHAGRLLEALSVRTPEDVDAALLAMSSEDAEEVITAKNGAAAAVRTRDEWLGTPMHETAGSGPWISLSSPVAAVSGTVRASDWVPSANPLRPLDGLRVLDLTRVIAGPTATRLMGALGADVLRIDPPGIPELTDVFVDAGFDKRSGEADLGKADALEAVTHLAATADVVITGYRDGALDRFGLSPGSLLALRPDLVVLTLNAWGNSGQWRGRRGFDSLVQAACGIADHYGHRDHEGWKPGALPVQALDHATGYGLAAAAIALLAERLSSGSGGAARLSLARTAEELFRLPADPRSQHAVPLREPNYHQVDSPYGTLRFVGLPILADGSQITFTEAPVRYGMSALTWR